MFSNYLSGRTRPLADIFKAPGLEDRSQPAASARNYGSTQGCADNLNRAAEQVRNTIFVQKLAVTLEPRHKDVDGEKLALLQGERKIVKEAAAAANLQNYNDAHGLGVLQEHEDEDEQLDDLSDSDDEDSGPQYWFVDGTRDRTDKKKKKKKTDNANDETVDPDDPPRSSFQATIKNMLSCILNWGSTPKEPAKGSREYYAARESLGEELGTFRKQTMPGLIERSKIKAELDRSRGETSRRDLQEFSNLIGERKSLVEEVASGSSTATIRPINGTLKLAKKPATLAQIPINNEPVKDKEVVYGSIKVQRPAVPIERDLLGKRLPSETEYQSQQLVVAAHQEPIKLSPPVFRGMKEPRPLNLLFEKMYNF